MQKSKIFRDSGSPGPVPMYRLNPPHRPACVPLTSPADELNWNLLRTTQPVRLHKWRQNNHYLFVLRQGALKARKEAVFRSKETWFKFCNQMVQKWIVQRNSPILFWRNDNIFIATFNSLFKRKDESVWDELYQSTLILTKSFDIDIWCGRQTY
jgi:hypothetical protein